MLTFNKELASFNVLNCDYKIAAEAIASRIKTYLPKLVLTMKQASLETDLLETPFV